MGGGLAGCEAAWALAERGVRVTLREMRPVKMTAAHQTDRLAELVCSNTFKSIEPTNAHGLLKVEMRRLGSLVLQAADEARVPGGAALAVDRAAFAEAVQRRVLAHPNITVERGEAGELPSPGIVATGPLTSDTLAGAIAERLGVTSLAFFDAIAPIVAAESLEMDRLFRASRYGKGGGDDYLNAPLARDEYEAFVDALLGGEQHRPHHEFDRTPYFEACLPIEEMAARGRDTLRFGPMKPVGLRDPRAAARGQEAEGLVLPRAAARGQEAEGLVLPRAAARGQEAEGLVLPRAAARGQAGTGQAYAVAQLRQEDRAAQMWNLVGFQTRLKIPEQQRIFRTLPGLGRAEFLRYGSIHRNSYINAPAALTPHLSTRDDPMVLFAGQLTGVEGYTESAGTGLLAGINLARLLSGDAPLVPPPTTMLGALYRYLRDADPSHFQPMNANFGLIEPLGEAVDKARRKELLAERAMVAIQRFADEIGTVSRAERGVRNAE